MKKISVTRDILAPPSRVWDCLTDPSVLTAAETGITSLSGPIAVGQRFSLTAEVSGARRFTITTTELSAPSRMVWRSGNVIFRGERVFALSPTPSGTRFEMTETFSGLMLGLIWRSMPDLTPSFERFAEALASLSERRAA